MSHSVIIVGAGPGGALLAYILASRGIHVTLIERHSDFAREFRGEGLSPGGQLMFREAGLWEEFCALPHVRFGKIGLYFKGRRFATVDIPEDSEVQPLWVSQPAMLEMLVKKASAFPSFTLLRGVRVAGPLMRGGRVVGVELADSVEDAEDTLEADYVFACDGRFSALRTAAGLDSPQTPEAFDIVWGKLPLPDFYDKNALGVRGYVGNGHLGLFIPSYDGLLQLGWVIRKGTYKDMKAKGIAYWMNEMAAHLSPDMAGHLRQHADDTVHPFLLDVICDCYERWSVPGMSLLGDSAHPMSPVGAQGINIALRDSVVAANHFVPLLRDGAAPEALDAAAAAFQAERMAEVAPIQKLQRRAPKIFFSTSIWLDVVYLVLRGLFASGIAQWLRARVDPRRNPFIFGVTDVKLEV